MKNLKKTSLKASFTVEAALLMPAVLGIITLIIYLGFYLYNNNILHQILSACVLHGTTGYEMKEEGTEKIEQNIAEMAREKLLSAQADNIYVEKKGDVITAAAGVSMRMKLPNFMDKISKNQTGVLKAEKKGKQILPAAYLRNFRKLEMIAEKIEKKDEE